LNNLVLTYKDIGDIRRYIFKRYGKSHFGLEPDDILNETILYMLETNREINPRHIASSTFYAISTEKKRHKRYLSLLSSHLLKTSENIKQDNYSFFSFILDKPKK
jgi:hypothetical protein